MNSDGCMPSKSISIGTCIAPSPCRLRAPPPTVARSARAFHNSRNKQYTSDLGRRAMLPHGRGAHRASLRFVRLCPTATTGSEIRQPSRVHRIIVLVSDTLEAESIRRSGHAQRTERRESAWRRDCSGNHGREDRRGQDCWIVEPLNRQRTMARTPPPRHWGQGASREHDAGASCRGDPARNAAKKRSS